MRRREGWVVELVEQSQLVVEQEGAVEAAVVQVDLAERSERAEALALGGLQQRPAGVLDPAAGRGVGAVVGVPFVAADLVGGACGEPDDVERVKADLGVRDDGAARWYSPLMSIETASIVAL